MDVRYINPFIQSIKNVFSTMLSTDILISKPFVKADEVPSADVSAVIGFSGDAQGCVALCFPFSAATKIAGKFAGVAMDENHDDFADALGELTNMVAGGAKAKMAGFDISISLPNVIVGKAHVVSQSKQAPRLILPCDSPLGRFCVEVAMVMDQSRAQSAMAKSAAGA